LLPSGYLRQGIAFREQLKLSTLSGREGEENGLTADRKTVPPEGTPLIKSQGAFQIQITGFDDMRYAALLPVSLTKCREIEEVDFRAMQGRIQNPTIPARTLVAAPQLVVRKSCGAYLR
jgi:hypothetical protein